MSGAAGNPTGGHRRVRLNGHNRGTNTPERTLDYPIGTKFMTRGKHPAECTVTDVWKTYNAAGELVQTRYVATHVFCGQTVTERDIVAVTIARGLLPQP